MYSIRLAPPHEWSLVPRSVVQGLGLSKSFYEAKSKVATALDYTVSIELPEVLEDNSHHALYRYQGHGYHAPTLRNTKHELLVTDIGTGDISDCSKIFHDEVEKDVV